MRSAPLAAVAFVAGVAIALTLVVLVRQDEAPPSVLVDERAGALHGVRFGDGEREVRELLGEEADDDDGFFPGGTDYTGPPVISSPETDRASRNPPSELHYDDAAYLVSPTVGVFAMAALEDGARTRAGIGVGDDLALVRERHDGSECGEAVAGEPLFGGEPPTYPWCQTTVRDTCVFFGGDPIESITLMRQAPIGPVCSRF